jgi:tight adherence protein B
MSKRRKSVQDSLKDLEKKQQENSQEEAATHEITADRRPACNITIAQFYMFSPPFSALCGQLRRLFAGPADGDRSGFAFVAGARAAALVRQFHDQASPEQVPDEFPNALDVMVRSIKSGLPLNDADPADRQRGKEPVKTEFRGVVESQQVGLSSRCMRAHDQTMPLPEVSFFAIVIAIQAQAGGNLSEALGNLSKVLRERKKMKAKVQALSMEAKASAVIIGALPFIVATLVYLTSPDYMMILFTDPRGHLIMGISAVWMSIGIYVMRNMINFDI